MWLLLSILSLFAYAISELSGKKTVDTNGALAPLEMLVFSSGCSFCFGIALFLLGLGESGLSPWQILFSHPLIIVNNLFYILGIFLSLFSLRFIGLAIESALAGTLGVFYFIGILLIHLTSGKLATVGDMLHPMRLIPLLCVIIFTVLFPNIEVLAHRKANASLKKAKAERRRTLLGFLILLFAMICESIATIIVTWIFDQKDLGPIDYLQTSYCFSILATLVFSFYLWSKKEKWYQPFKNANAPMYLYAFMHIVGAITYSYASTSDAVRTGLIFIAYPIVPIIGARIFLKEKYTWRQNLCIWIIALSSIVFCLIDQFLKV